MVNIKSPPTEARKNTVVTKGCHAMNRALRDNILPHFSFRHAAPPPPHPLPLHKLHQYKPPQSKR